jgi:hypothetical protein
MMVFINRVCLQKNIWAEGSLKMAADGILAVE